MSRLMWLLYVVGIADVAWFLHALQAYQSEGGGRGALAACIAAGAGFLLVFALLTWEWNRIRRRT